jgi:peptide/nickel transport system substrate-binding protein
METRYRLRPNLTWHDGSPLSADDFVFSWRVYSTPELGQSASPPTSLMEEVAAPDPLTLLIRWKGLYVDAGVLEASGVSNTPSFPPLPRHLLREPLRQGPPDTFVTLPFWSTEYVGAGPYRLDRWQAGSFLEAAAFEGHALGRPRIERLRVLFIPDFNTALANMLSGEAQITIDDTLSFQQALLLRREWTPRGAGTVLLYPQYWRWITIQQRPELASPRALTDPRVRQALAHAVDKAALNDALFEGEGIMTETPVPPNAPSFAEVDRAAVRRPYDLARTDQLMTEAGFARGADGIYASPAGGRFATELIVFTSPQNEAEMTIMGAGWRQAGFDVKEAVWASVLARDAQLRNTHPGLSGTGGPSGEATIAQHNTAELPRPENRWTGVNRGGWTHPEFDRLATTFNATLDRAERTRLLVQMVRIYTEDVAAISLYFNLNVSAFAAALEGPGIAVPESDVTWNIYEWELR